MRILSLDQNLSNFPINKGIRMSNALVSMITTPQLFLLFICLFQFFIILRRAHWVLWIFWIIFMAKHRWSFTQKVSIVDVRHGSKYTSVTYSKIRDVIWATQKPEAWPGPPQTSNMENFKDLDIISKLSTLYVCGKFGCVSRNRGPVKINYRKN